MNIMIGLAWMRNGILVFLVFKKNNVMLLKLGYHVIWVKIVLLVQILLVQTLKIQMFYVCQFVA